MTINQAITQLRALKPTQYDDNTMIGWLSNLDGMIYEEIVKWHEPQKDAEGNEIVPGHGPYDAETDPETVLLVPDPYTDVYIKYLAAQIDFYNGEYNRYNNSMVMYNMALQGFANWYNREHKPRQEHYIRI